MKKTMKKKVNESIEWLIEQIMEKCDWSREHTVTYIEDYLERHW